MIKLKKYAVEYQGALWGTTYADGYSTSKGWTTDVSKADLSTHRPSSPTHLTYKASPHYAELSKGRVVEIEILTSWRYV